MCACFHHQYSCLISACAFTSCLHLDWLEQELINIDCYTTINYNISSINHLFSLKANDVLLLFAILFLWLNLENHLHYQNAIIVSEYKIIIFWRNYFPPLYELSFWN